MISVVPYLLPICLTRQSEHLLPLVIHIPLSSSYFSLQNSYTQHLKQSSSFYIFIALFSIQNITTSPRVRPFHFSLYLCDKQGLCFEMNREYYTKPWMTIIIIIPFRLPLPISPFTLSFSSALMVAESVIIQPCYHTHTHTLSMCTM